VHATSAPSAAHAVARAGTTSGTTSGTSSGAALSLWTTRYESELVSGALRIPTPYVARLAGGADVTLYRLVTTHVVTAHANWHATGPRPFTAGPRNPAFELPGTALLDLGISVGFHAPRRAVATLVALAVDNALDLAWQSVRGFPSPGRTWALTITITPAAR
jgi:hypothetical protein